MSGRKSGLERSRSVVVIAGEDRNDRESLKILLEEQQPGLRGGIVQIRDPVRLHKATGANLSKRVRTIVNKAQGVAEKQGEGTRVACLYVHEDLDGVDGNVYLETRQRVEQEIRRQLGCGHYVLAVAEMEAWMLLFPDALSAVVKAWKVPAKYRGKDTGRFQDPKRILMREVSGTKGQQVHRIRRTRGLPCGHRWRIPSLPFGKQQVVVPFLPGRRIVRETAPSRLVFGAP